MLTEAVRSWWRTRRDERQNRGGLRTGRQSILRIARKWTSERTVRRWRQLPLATSMLLTSARPFTDWINSRCLKGHLRFFEIALVLVCLDYVANRVATANRSMM